MHENKFAKGAGRKRPEYRPRNIRCVSCGAGLTLKNEATEFVACEYCGTHLELTPTEEKIVGKNHAKVDFPISIGDSFHYKTFRYEVIGRMAMTEDGDMDEMTRQYLLFHPFHGALWLSEYQGMYSLFHTSHVMPETDAFSLSPGQTMRTHDNRTWVFEEKGETELVYVDGALPWVATIGDRAEYAAFSEKKNPDSLYEVERIHGEMEFAAGEEFSAGRVQEALGMPALAAKEKKKEKSPLPWYIHPLWVSLMIFVLNLILGAFVQSRGQTETNFSFSAEELSITAFSKEFRVSSPGSLVKVEVEADPKLENAWMNLKMGLVDSDGYLLHDEEETLYRYTGETAEGIKTRYRSKGFMRARLASPGTYTLVLHANSAKGETQNATRAVHGAKAGVWVGKYASEGFAGMAMFSLFFVFLPALAFRFLKFAFFRFFG